jgi:hypothetical protein
MKIRVTRADPLAGMPDPENHAPGLLSQDDFDSWEAVFRHLREERKIPLTPGHEEQFRSHPDTQFTRQEFVMGFESAYLAGVMYDVRVIEA